MGVSYKNAEKREIAKGIESQLIRALFHKMSFKNNKNKNKNPYRSRKQAPNRAYYD